MTTTAVEQSYVGLEIPLKDGSVLRCRALPLRQAVKFLHLCTAWERGEAIEATLGVIAAELPDAIGVPEEELQAYGLTLGDVYGMLVDHFFPARRYQPVMPSAPLQPTVPKLAAVNGPTPGPS